MRVISVNGYKHSGKTTICEAIIKTLRKRGYTVGSCKEIYNESFMIDDDPTRNTRRHRDCGSQLVIGRTPNESDVLIQRRITISELLSYFNHDFLILESVRDCVCPRIVASKTIEDVEDHKIRAVAVSGVISSTGIKEISGLPVLNSFTDDEQLADIVEKYAFEPLPGLDLNECGRCGYSCNEMANRIISGQNQRSMCPYSRSHMNILHGGESVCVDDIQITKINKALSDILGLNIADCNISINII